MKKKNFLIMMFIFISIVAMSVMFFSSKKNEEIVYEEKKEFNIEKDFELYVKIEETKDVINQINVDFTEENEKYVGIIYLPGNVEDNNCKISWNSDSVLFLSDGLNTYENAQYILKTTENNINFSILCDNSLFDFEFDILKGSKDVDQLFIDIDESVGTINSMNNDKNHETECFGQMMVGENKEFISIKGRGNSTWKAKKKPYNISFYDSNEYDNKKNASLIEGIETKTWSMLANFADPTLMRNYIGYQLAEKMGIGLPSKFYDVWLNGEYLGNYLITPKNDYRAPKNGFLLELDNVVDDKESQFYLDVNGEKNDNLLFTIKKRNEDYQEEDIKEWMQKAFDAIEDYDSDEYQKYIDIESWAKMYLIYELNKNSDFISGSIYMYRNGNGEEDTLMAGPIWDLDCSFGRSYSDIRANYCKQSLMPVGSYIASNSEGIICLLNELGKHNSFIDEVKHIHNVYKGDISDMLNEIDEVEALIKESALMDFEKWEDERGDFNAYRFDQYIRFINDEMYFDDVLEIDYINDYFTEYVKTESYDDYINNLKSFISGRSDYLYFMFAN